MFSIRGWCRQAGRQSFRGSHSMSGSMSGSMRRTLVAVLLLPGVAAKSCGKDVVTEGETSKVFALSGCTSLNLRHQGLDNLAIASLAKDLQGNQVTGRPRCSCLPRRDSPCVAYAWREYHACFLPSCNTCHASLPSCNYQAVIPATAFP